MCNGFIIKMRIDILMLERGLHQNFVAKKVGVSDETITNWKNGRTLPRLDQAVKLADLFGVNTEDIYEVKTN